MRTPLSDRKVVKLGPVHSVAWPTEQGTTRIQVTFNVNGLEKYDLPECASGNSYDLCRTRGFQSIGKLPDGSTVLGKCVFIVSKDK